MEETIMTFEAIVNQAAIALQDAIESYGPDAVDLALKVYWLEGVKGTIGVFVVLMIIAGLVVITAWAWSSRIKWEESVSDFHKTTPTLFISLFTIFSFLGSMVLLDSAVSKVYHMAAAFGYPELLIVAKALKAAGFL